LFAKKGAALRKCSVGGKVNPSDPYIFKNDYNYTSGLKTKKRNKKKEEKREEK